MPPMIFTPIKIGQLVLKNRIAMSPMCMYSGNGDGKVTDFHFVHYGARATGQVGLIILEVCSVHPDGMGNPKELGIWEDGQIEGLKRIVEFVHAEGSKIAIQIGHAGRKSELPAEPLAPSAIAYDNQSRTPGEMSRKDIENMIDCFKAAAARAKKAGFDAIELHAAHGYLINQFLSPLTNQRQDAYGGSIQNRVRFLVEIIETIKEIWNQSIFVRISADEFHEKGNSLEEILYIVKAIEDAGVDLVTCSAGGVVPNQVNVYPGYEVPYAEYVKPKTNILVGTVGLITEAVHAEEILRNKRADIILLGRELLRNPFWLYQASEKIGYAIEAPFQYKRGWDFDIGKVLR